MKNGEKIVDISTLRFLPSAQTDANDDWIDEILIADNDTLHFCFIFIFK